MESKNMEMLMTMMFVIVMGKFLVQTEASYSQFNVCYSDCLVVCRTHTSFPKSVMCPFTCIMTCIVPALPSPPPSPSSSSGLDLANKIDNTNHFCKLGCAALHCVSLSSRQNPNVDEVAKCVDSCSDKCSKEKKK
ncbi:unnamed protein product [Cochlearia groenlandica]